MYGVLFRDEVEAAVRIWDSSTAYNHCWLVLPVALWLAWTRLDRLRGLGPRPLPAAALLGLAPALAWFAAERLGIMEGRQLALIGMTWALFLGVLGWPAFRAMAAPLAYLIFLVPFGAFITPVLQSITARIIEFCLQLSGIPHYVDDLIIEIPAGTFWVAEACAGLRFLIAAIAFGALYAVVMFRSPGRRLIVLVLSVVVPIVANGLRAFGIVLLGHFLGSAEAAAADHVVYGWLFFSVVILLLIAAGLPFREDGQPEERAPAPANAGRPAAHSAGVVLAGVVALATAGSGPVAAAALQGGGWGADSAVAAVPLALAPPSGCVAAGTTLRCGPAQAPMIVSADMMTFPPRVSWAAIGAARLRGMGEAAEEDSSFSVAVPGQALWQGRLTRDPASPRAVAAAVWLDGAPSGGGLRARVDQALHSLRGDSGSPVLVVVRVSGATKADQPGSAVQGEVLRALLAEQGAAIAAQAAARSAAGAR
jgi:exosortase A